MNHLIGIIGTNSEPPTNRTLLTFMARHFAKDATIEVVEIKDIPMFNKPSNMEVPKEVLALAEKIEAVDGFIISTP